MTSQALDLVPAAGGGNVPPRDCAAASLADLVIITTNQVTLVNSLMAGLQTVGTDMKNMNAGLIEFKQQTAEAVNKREQGVRGAYQAVRVGAPPGGAVSEDLENNKEDTAAAKAEAAAAKAAAAAAQEAAAAVEKKNKSLEKSNAKLKRKYEEMEKQMKRLNEQRGEDSSDSTYQPAANAARRGRAGPANANAARRGWAGPAQANGGAAAAAAAAGAGRIALATAPASQLQPVRRMAPAASASQPARRGPLVAPASRPVRRTTAAAPAAPTWRVAAAPAAVRPPRAAEPVAATPAAAPAAAAGPPASRPFRRAAAAAVSAITAAAELEAGVAAVAAAAGAAPPGADSGQLAAKRPQLKDFRMLCEGGRVLPVKEAPVPELKRVLQWFDGVQGHSTRVLWPSLAAPGSPCLVDSRRVPHALTPMSGLETYMNRAELKRLIKRGF